MQLEAGKILEGKVTGITKFGAFIELEPGTVGMVHISEVSSTFVNDINDVLQMNQTVKVKVLNVGDDGKISLSIKKALPPAPRKDGNFNRDRRDNANRGNRPQNGGASRSRDGQSSGAPNRGGNRPQNSRPSNPRPDRAPQNYYPPQQKGPASFEDMLSKFMQSSDEKISGLKKDRAVSRKGGGQKRR